jgi:hypothetical protein
MIHVLHFPIIRVAPDPIFSIPPDPDPDRISEVESGRIRIRIPWRCGQRDTDNEENSKHKLEVLVKLNKS